MQLNCSVIGAGSRAFTGIGIRIERSPRYDRANISKTARTYVHASHSHVICEVTSGAIDRKDTPERIEVTEETVRTFHHAVFAVDPLTHRAIIHAQPYIVVSVVAERTVSSKHALRLSQSCITIEGSIGVGITGTIIQTLVRICIVESVNRADIHTLLSWLVFASGGGTSQQTLLVRIVGVVLLGVGGTLRQATHGGIIGILLSRRKSAIILTTTIVLRIPIVARRYADVIAHTLVRVRTILSDFGRTFINTNSCSIPFET
jgi:hypothetical protein